MHKKRANQRDIPVSVTQTDKPFSSPQQYSYYLRLPGPERRELLTHKTKIPMNNNIMARS